MKKAQVLTCCLLAGISLFATKSSAQLGVGTTTPDASAQLDVVSTAKGALLPRLTAAQRTAIASPATGLIVYQTDATTGFYYYNGTAWQVIGSGTIAAGTNSIISGDGCSATNGIDNVALGYNCHADMLQGSVAMGRDCTANIGLALGDNCMTGWGGFTGSGEIAIGSDCYTASTNSFAIGNSSHVNYPGGGCYAVGNSCVASQNGSFAIGNGCQTNANNSFALGNNVGTSTYVGSFIVGDNSTNTITNNTTANQMIMRFDGGYILYSQSDLSTGVQLASGGNSWSTTSDRRKKENFATVNGEDFLNRISGFHLTSWNYKGQDAKTFRHYGPMAQDFYAAFGRDSYGTVGNDTTIGQADMEGVSFIAIQALVKRTTELKIENDQLRTQVAELSHKMTVEETDLADRLAKMEASLTSVLEEGKVAETKR